MERIKWGIVGLGNIASKFAQDLILLPQAELYAVASRSLTKAIDFKNLYGAKVAYGSYIQIIDDEQVDIIYVATPHDSHMQISLKAMSKGKHVLCEKPLAVNEIQVSNLISASKANKVFLMEAFWSRFNPSIIDVLDRIKRGELGTIEYIDAEFSFPGKASAESRLYNLERAGGSLLDVGVYPLFLAYSIFGMPQEILASAIFHETGADAQTVAILKYKGGIANLMSGFKIQSAMTAKIYGQKATIILDPPWHQTQGYQIIKQGKSEKFSHPTLGLGFTYEIEECHHCIIHEQQQSIKWSHQDSLNLVKLTDMIRQKIGLTYPFE